MGPLLGSKSTPRATPTTEISLVLSSGIEVTVRCPPSLKIYENGTDRYSHLLSGIKMEVHNGAVAMIAATVRQYYDRREPFRIFHRSTNSTRSSAYPQERIPNTGPLSHILEVNTKTRTALVEPTVPMDRLLETTMKYGLVPAVVREFPGITVGGGYAGTSGESSSFKHGFFDRTIKSVEMVLANGEVVTASPTERADLFHGAAGALGTLGITTFVELQLMEVKIFVETTYHPVTSVAEAIQKRQEATASHIYDYVDGILFSKY